MQEEHAVCIRTPGGGSKVLERRVPNGTGVGSIRLRGIARGTCEQVWGDSEEQSTWNMKADFGFVKPKINGASINDGIQEELCSLQYVKVNEVVEAILTGTELAKIDIKSAYRIVPVSD